MSRGLAAHVMRCIDRLENTEFNLQEAYMFENELSRIYPGNKHIREKIRPQVQLLYDNGFLDLVERVDIDLCNSLRLHTPSS